LETQLLAAVLIILIGLLVERAWSWRNGRRSHNNNPNLMGEMKTEVAVLGEKIEASSKLMDTGFENIRDSIGSLEARVKAIEGKL